jgi:hypothetical protein
VTGAEPCTRYGAPGRGRCLRGVLLAAVLLLARATADPADARAVR